MFGSQKWSWADNEIIKYTSEARLVKIAGIIAFNFIVLALTIIIKTSPANGYEISIYNIYPWYFWVFIITSIFIGQLILVSILRNGSASCKKDDNLWAIGFLAILITNAILLFMPFIRGYATYGRGDVLTHIGYIKDIQETANIGIDNFYPLDHILTVSLSYITNISVEHTVNIIPSIFSLFYIISIYFLVQKIFGMKKEIRSVLAFSSILLFSNENLIFAPSVQSFLFFPFVYYIYFKSRDSSNSLKYNFILIILLFFIVFFHPMTELFLIFIFLILEFCLFSYKKINEIHVCELHNLLSRRSLDIIIISLVTFFMWYFSFAAIVKSFQKVTNALLNISDSTQAKAYTEFIMQTQPEVSDLIKVILDSYGQLLVLISLSVLFSIWIFRILRTKKGRESVNFYHFFFSLVTLSFITLLIIFFFNDLIIGFGRISKYLLFCSSVFVGLSFCLLLNKTHLSICRQIFVYVTLCLVLISLISFSTFNLYFSPIIKMSNQQVTENEIIGMTWFFDHRNENMLIQEIGLSQFRFHNAIYGRHAPVKNIWYENTRPIDHFDYTNQTSFGDYDEDIKYMLVTTLGRITYPELYPNYKKQWRFTPDDFHMLENDKTVLRIYDNSNLNVYFID